MRRLALIALPLALLAACQTPREACVSDAGRQLSIVEGLIRETQGNPTATPADMYASVMGKNLLKSVFDAAIGVINLTVSDLQTAMAAIIPLGPYTVATLPAPAASNLGRNAIVTDLFGNRYGRVRCESVGSFYFWQPQSSDSFGNVATASNVTVTPLGYAQTLNLTGSLAAGVTRTITLSTVGGWPGAIKEIHSDTTLGLGAALNIVGTGLGSGLSLLAGGYKKYGLDYTGTQLEWKLLT